MNTTERTLPIVVGIDGSKLAVHAAQWAAGEADRRHLSVTLLHVLSRSSHLDTVFAAPAVDQDYAEAALAEATEAIRATGSTASVATKSVTGDPTGVLLDASSRASMIVVGSAGASSVARLWLGSTAATLAESAECDVVIVRAETGDSHGAVIVGLGPSGSHGVGEDADSVCTAAYRMASSANANIVGVRVARALNLVDPSAYPVSDPVPEASIDDRMALVAHEFPSVHADTAVIEGPPGTELVELSAHARLVVIGHDHGRRAGPTLHALLRQAKCPVMIVQHA